MTKIPGMMYHKRTKHIETKYYLIREKYDQQEITVSYVNTKQQLADILTKDVFQHLRHLHGLVAPSSRTSGRLGDTVLAEDQRHQKTTDTQRSQSDHKTT